MKVLTCSCCDGHCGPNNGCNCLPCQKLDQEEAQQHKEDLSSPKQSQPIINSWTWGDQPGMYLVLSQPIINCWRGGGTSQVFSVVAVNKCMESIAEDIKCIANIWIWILDSSQLKQCLKSILFEHQKLCTEASCTSASITRLQQRLAILQRYFIALGRQSPNEGRQPSKKSQADQTNLNKQKRYWKINIL